MDVSPILFQVLSLFLMMALGLMARKLGFITDEVKRGMTDILIKIATPAIIISSFLSEFESDKATNALIVLAGAIIMHTTLCLVSFLIFKKETPERRAVLRFAMIFGNFGFIGLPVLQSIYGLDGVFYGAMFSAAFYAFSWSFGVSIYTEKKSFKETVKMILKNVPFLSVVLGFVLYVTQLPLPAFLEKTIDAVGAMNTPLSMLIIGSTFAEIKFSEVFTDLKVYIISAARLLIVPISAALLIWALNLTGLVNFHGIPFQIICVEEAMPCAAYCAIFATKFGGDVKFASKTVVIATALSVLTIPTVVAIISALGI